MVWKRKAIKQFSSLDRGFSKNQFLGDGVKFFQNLLHKDNLPFTGIVVGVIYFISKGNVMEKDIIELKTGMRDLNKKFDSTNRKLDSHLAIIMASVNLKTIPSEVTKALNAQAEPDQNDVEEKIAEEKMVEEKPVPGRKFIDFFPFNSK